MDGNNDHPTTGIIGLGSMGIGLAQNILQAGIQLKGFDINVDSLAKFSEMGGKSVNSSKEAATNTDLLIIMVVNGKQAKEVLLGNEGAASAMNPDGTILLCSTVSPQIVEELNGEIQKVGLKLLDAPVSGGKAGADAGTLSVMASGAREAFEAARQVLNAIASRVFELGERPGMGATYKVVHQLATGVHLAAAAELMALGVKAGCDPKILLDVVSNSSGQSWMMDDRAPQMISGEFNPRSMVDIFVKDLGLVKEIGSHFNVPLPLSDAAHRQFVAASEMGFGQLDDSAIVKVYESVTKYPVCREKEADS